ncbi:metalloregulator ArsR/SmtB family transcription factor [Amycolatopsis cynarae]|uniref:Metalloregulator ArsR/SmtB family transcription factor n=1 Tax=Amycolatopsis cynarae TaxID=2995223 RepID=A0ABY7B1R0_9PSEU|nr:metalloregulator ArsR/SmtB family transcription factor [Amycolatopsis sp. HUAS 11-8]WAL65900.1 metalloregulator ArsR/SmtB family transcription factor [Amycolatopsis sp. HUAS 11-8]
MKQPSQPSAADLSLVDVLGALADPTRLALVARLANLGSQKCADINNDAEVHKSTMSHHYRVLRQAGLTTTTIRGRERWIDLRRADLDERFPGVIDSVLNSWNTSPQ